MSSEILVAGARFIPVKDAAGGVDISAGYIARLCREGSVHGRLEGGQWYVNPEALDEFLKAHAHKKEEWRKELAQKRKHEFANGNGHHKAIMTIAPRTLSHVPQKIRRTLRPTQILLAGLTLFAVLTSGALAFTNIAPQESAALANKIAHAPEIFQSQLAAAASLPLIDHAANALFNFICPFLHSCSSASVAVQIATTQIPQRPIALLATTTPHLAPAGGVQQTVK